MPYTPPALDLYTLIADGHWTGTVFSRLVRKASAEHVLARPTLTLSLGLLVNIIHKVEDLLATFFSYWVVGKQNSSIATPK